MTNLKLNSSNKPVLQFITIPKEFYERDTRIVAIELLGKYLIHQIDGKTFIGKIVETEAYLGEIDPACHAYTGNSKRNSVFSQPGGFTYVYMIYGKYFCLNVITNPPLAKGAVLIRALEPISGIEFMKHNRNSSTQFKLTNGPGKLSQAFQITMRHNKIPLFNGNLTINEQSNNSEQIKIGVSKRIGISKAKDWDLRYFILHNEFVSKQQISPLYDLNTRELYDISQYTTQ